MRRDSGRRPLAYAAATSIALHLLLLVANPGVPVHVRRSGNLHAPRPAGPALLTIREVPGDVAGGEAPGAPRPTGPRSLPADTTPVRLGAGPAAPVPFPRTGDPLAPLRATRDPDLWRVPALPAESVEQRALRELRERLAIAVQAPLTHEERRAIEGAGVTLPDPGGVRIPFGRKPPPPAQTIPAPARMATLRQDSTHRSTDVVAGYYGGYTIRYPAAVRAGRDFDLHVQLPRALSGIRVRAFVDGAAAGETRTEDGAGRIALRFDRAGEHRVLLHFLADDDPAQLTCTLIAGI